MTVSIPQDPAPDAPASASPATPQGRIDLVDLARGVALLAMFVFHFAYDLSYFGLIETDIPAEPGWRWFARSIAASFLTLVGISLVLATRHGLNRAAYLKRLAMVAGAAALVTLGTYVAMPANFIFFGILHQVAFASVLALPFLRLPIAIVALTGLAVFALPQLVAHPWLDRPWAYWLGFARQMPATADFVPVFPWFGWVLTGIVVARLALPALPRSRLARWRATAPPALIVSWGGRNSLLVYLLHQPLFIGAILLALPWLAPAPSEERPFMLSCQRSCVGTLDATTCDRLCACTVDGLKREGLWRQVLSDRMTPDERARTGEIAQGCVGKAKPAP